MNRNYQHQSVSILKFLPLMESAGSGLREEWEKAKQDLPRGFMPFALEIYGEAICFCLRKQDYGAVYVSDGYVEYLGRRAGVMRLAGSFAEFLDMLFDQKANEPIDVVYQLASSGKKEDLVAYLAKGGKITDASRLGRNIAQTAAAHGNLEMLKACMELGGDIMSCLTIAVRTRQFITMRYLVEAGANVNEIDPVSNRTPLQSITGVWGEEREEVEQYLRSHGAKK